MNSRKMTGSCSFCAAEKKTSSIRDFLMRTITPQKAKPTPKSPLQMLESGDGFRYVNRSSSSEPPSANPLETLKAKNAVYCAIVLDEFVQELAALSQEHAALHANLVPSQ